MMYHQTGPRSPCDQAGPIARLFRGHYQRYLYFAASVIGTRR